MTRKIHFICCICICRSQGHFYFMSIIFLFVFIFSSCFCGGYFTIEDGSIVDENGRESIFHGVNAVYKVPPYYPDPYTFNTNTSLCAEDAKLLKKWGFSVVRLYISWPGVAPLENLTFNETYVKMVEKIVNILGDEGIMTILDLHQDVGSRYLCGEGVPDWMFEKLTIKHPFPKPFRFDIPLDEHGYPIIDDCKKHSFSLYYFTFATGQLWKEMYTNGSVLYDGLLSFWDDVSKYFSTNKNVLGYELLNEPWVGDLYEDPLLLIPGETDKKYLQPLYDELFQTVLSNDPNHLIFYEPNVEDQGHAGFTKSPGYGTKKDVFAYHLYCLDRDAYGVPKRKYLCEVYDDLIFSMRTKDAERLKGGIFVTEFGSTENTTKGVESLAWIANEFEKRKTSWIYWQYKLFNDYTDSSHDTEGFFNQEGELEVNKVKSLSRTYALRTCGRSTSNEFDPKTSKWEYHYTALSTSCDGSPTIVYLNQELYYPNGYVVDVQPENILSWEMKEENYLEFTPSSSFSPGSEIVITITSK